MKHILTSKMLRKFMILSCLVVGLVFISSSDLLTQTALARPCCDSCEVPPGEPLSAVYNYCQNECGASSGTCYSQCVGRVNGCRFNCEECTYGVPCNNNGDCDVIYGFSQCVGGYCQ